MKNKKIWILLPAMFLASCGGGTGTSAPSAVPSTPSGTPSLPPSSGEIEDDTKITLERLNELLLGKIAENEVLKSSKAEFSEVDQRGDLRRKTIHETMNIYSDNVSVTLGTNESTYMQGGEVQTKSDTYVRVADTIDYDGQEVFYRVTDYQDGTIDNSWQDDAKRLPIYASGDPAYDGYTYLSKGSVPGQLTMQVSLVMYNFIGGYLLGNPDLQTTMPYAQKVVEGDVTTYQLENFTYGYVDEGSTVKVEINFRILVENEFLQECQTSYKTTTSRGDEQYVEELTTDYHLSYEDRVRSDGDSNLFNVEDYFLQEVTAVKAYYYDDEGKRQDASLNNLPLGKYVRFEAEEFTPSKAVDKEMYAVESSDEAIVGLSGNVFETKATGEATLKLMSATGATLDVHVRINMPEITRIKFDDISSAIERDSSGNKYIYTSTTYSKGVYVSVNPSAASLEDIEIAVSDESVLTVTPKITGKVMELTLVVGETNLETVSVTFTSKTNSEVRLEVVFHIKQRLSEDEMFEKLMSHTYRWNNLYASSQYGLMVFTSRTEGKVTYYDGNEELGTTTFTYSIQDTNFRIQATSDSLFGYNSGEITLDGTSITACVDDVTYVHTYKIVEGTV